MWSFIFVALASAPVQASELSTYFLPPKLWQVYGAESAQQEGAAHAPRGLLQDYESEIRNQYVVRHWDDRFMEGEAFEVVSPAQLMSVVHHLGTIDPAYFEKIKSKPERLRVDIQFNPSHQPQASKDYTEALIRRVVDRLRVLRQSSGVQSIRSQADFHIWKQGEFIGLLLGRDSILKDDEDRAVMMMTWLIVNHFTDFGMGDADVARAIRDFDFSRLIQVNRRLSNELQVPVKRIGQVSALAKRFKRPVVETFWIQEDPMYLSIYRGGCGDCSFKQMARYFPLMPSEHSFYIYDQLGGQKRQIGFISTVVIYTKAGRTLLIKDIVSPKRLGSNRILPIVEAFAELKSHYKVEAIALPMSDYFMVHNHGHYLPRELKKVISNYGLGSSPAFFIDDELRRKHSPDNTFDLAKYHERVELLDLRKLPGATSIQTQLLSSVGLCKSIFNK